jgi:DMSO/TMAO reductase YedYZ molybdopterin-dependent catalytic subunit
MGVMRTSGTAESRSPRPSTGLVQAGLSLALLVMALLAVVACAPAASPAAPRTFTPSAQPTPSAEAAPATPATPAAPGPTLPQDVAGSACGLPPIVVPTPAEDPGYTQLDPSTGLHMTGKMQLVDLSTYRLRVTGLVDRSLELTYEEIRCLPKVQASPLLVCPGFFEDQATWAGTPIADVLALAGVQAGAQRLELVGGDGYTTLLPLEDALDRANFLAYEWEGEPLPRLHGFPLRVVIPDAQGNQWTKWLLEIRVK